MQPTSAPLTETRRAEQRPPWVGDLMGGLTSAVVALPLALAFAVASGVDPKAGLYTAIVAGIVASLFGGSPLQITGPTGAMAVILAGIVAQYGLERVWIAGLMAGVIQLGLGLGRLGRWAALLPLPLITGFTNGIAILIFTGQIGNFLGVAHLTPKAPLLKQAWWQMTHLGQANLAAVIITVGVIGVMVLWGKVNQTVPGSLVALLIATVGSTLLGLDLPRIGAIPQGLPMPSMPPFSFGMLNELIRPALALAALGAIESLLSAAVADRLSGSKPHDPDKELVGQGLANIAVPFFGGIPATGAIARTAVNIRSGGKTRLSGVIHGLAIALVVVALGPLAANIPLAALAGILMVTSWRMIEWDQVKLLLRSTKSDLTVMATTWLVTVIFDLVLAVEAGLVIAVSLFLRRMADVHLISHQEVCRECGVPEALADDIRVYEVDRPLFFGDARRFAETVLSDVHCRGLVLGMAAVTTMDVTAAIALGNVVRELQHRGVKVALCGLSAEVSDLLERLGVAGTPYRFERVETGVSTLAHELSGEA
ncbi:MAG TPA: SulP family inorganic anion transporter [Pantanalinema sp.]